MKILTIKQDSIFVAVWVQIADNKKTPHIHVVIRLIELFYQSIWQVPFQDFVVKAWQSR